MTAVCASDEGDQREAGSHSNRVVVATTKKGSQGGGVNAQPDPPPWREARCLHACGDDMHIGSTSHAHGHILHGRAGQDA